MTEAQKQLQNALTTTFLANLAFLSEYDNDLYHKVDELSRMIENGTYQEKYALEFNMQDGEFDIYDIVHNKYLYNKQPKKINDDLVRKIEFDDKNTIFNIDEYFLIKNQGTINFSNRFLYENSTDFAKLTSANAFEYSSYLKDFVDKKNKKFKKINKFIFLGTLLGRHIPRIAKKLNAKIYLVLERNLEIFRLSLFTVDYTVLSKNGVIFSIMDNDQQEEEKINLFINLNYFDNYLLKFSTTNINIEKYVDKILTSLISLKPTTYDYNRLLYVKLNRSTNTIKSNYKTLHFNELKKNIILNFPILFIAAGPSFQENLNWIKKNQDNFFIVTIGAAYKKLLDNNIHIDMITTLDEDSIIEKVQFPLDELNKINKNTLILANSSSNPNLLKKLEQFNLYLYETQIPLHKDDIAFTGFSIGEITIDLLLKMNAKQIYLLGLDLALNQDTGLSHSIDSSSYIKSYNLDENNDKKFFSLNEGLIEVKGNLKEFVKTTSLFYSSIASMNEKLKDIKEDIKIYNLSSHGSYFINTIPTNINLLNLTTTNINFNKSSLINNLNKSSSNDLSIESKKSIINEINFLNNILENDIKIFNDKIFNNFEDFSNNYRKLLILIQNYKGSLINEILKVYSMTIFPYLSFHFNDIKVKNEAKKICGIKKILVNQLRNILTDYIKCIERIKN